MRAVTTAILFDFGGTLDADGVTWKSRFRRLCLDEQLDAPPDRFDSVFYEVDDALCGAIPSSLTFAETIGRLAVGLTRGLGSRDAHASARIADRFLGDAMRCVERNRAVLVRLGERYRLGIVSNFYGNLVTVCHNAGIDELFSVIVDSTDVGCAKPDPLIFRHALDALGVTPADAVFVGDSLPRDMAGARAIGMRHIWLAGETADSSMPCCPGDPTVHSLGELEGLLL